MASGGYYFDPTPGLNVVRGRAAGKAGAPRVAYPARGIHSLGLTNAERRFVRAALEGLSAGGFVRRAVCAAAGLAATGAVRDGDGTVPRRVCFRLSRDERAAIDRAARDRDLEAWFRDAVRSAAGMRNTRWSPCADAYLRMRFRRADRDDLLRALPGRNPMTVHARAKTLGLSLPLPEDRLTIVEAARVANYDPKAVVRILHAAGVAPRTLVGQARDPKRPRRFVTRAELDRAVRHWHTTETVSAAARRHRCCDNALTRWLREAGHAPVVPGRFPRFARAAIDAVVAAQRQGETIDAAARRVGVRRAALRQWLVAAGLVPGGRPHHYHQLSPQDVDRVVAAHRNRQRTCARCGTPGHYRTTCPRAGAGA